MTRIRGRGTAEEQWAAWSAPAAWPRLDLVAVRRAVVVAPHPDDEVLGTGGIMATLAARDVPVTVVAVTDGEASHPGWAVPDDVARRRTGESLAALADLGLGPEARHRLGIPDGHVAEAESGVLPALSGLIGPGDHVFATSRDDGHPDHEAVGRAAAAACARAGATLLEYPVWMWHWADVDDPRVPWHRAAVVELAPDVVAAKQRALSRFASQVEPLGPAPGQAAILPPHVLARFRRPWEMVLT